MLAGKVITVIPHDTSRPSSVIENFSRRGELSQDYPPERLTAPFDHSEISSGTLVLGPDVETHLGHSMFWVVELVSLHDFSQQVELKIEDSQADQASPAV